MRRHGSVLGLLIAVAATAGAQPTTARLEPGTDFRFEVGAGMEWLKLSGDNSGYVLGAFGGMRKEFEEAGVALRLDGVLLRRSFERRQQNGQQITTTHQVIGIIGATDIEFRLGPEATIAPVAGLGIAPWVHSTGTLPRGTGTLWTLGMVLRVRKLIVRQHLIGLLGVQESIPQFREYYPLTIGWRF